VTAAFFPLSDISSAIAGNSSNELMV